MVDQFKIGMFLLIDNMVHEVVKRQMKTQGRQGGLIILKLRNLDKDGQLLDKTVKAGTKFEQVITTTVEGQFTYSDGDSAYFMNTETFETLDISHKVLGDYAQFLKEGDKNIIMMYGDRVLTLRRNNTVTLEVTESVDAVKGNTANQATKIVTTETGYKVNVPLFVNKGDEITINTENGEYMSRVSK